MKATSIVVCHIYLRIKLKIKVGINFMISNIHLKKSQAHHLFHLETFNSTNNSSTYIMKTVKF